MAEEKTETHSIVPHPGHHGIKPHNRVPHIFLHEGIKETERGNQVKRSKLWHRAHELLLLLRESDEMSLHKLQTSSSSSYHIHLGATMLHRVQHSRSTLSKEKEEILLLKASSWASIGEQ